MRGTPNLEGIGVTSAGFRSDPQALPCQQVSTRLLSVCEDASKALKRILQRNTRAFVFSHVQTTLS